MRKLIALVAGLAVLAIVNFGIYRRELLLTRGRIVLLELAPVDPRSLMQGDYMRLNFALANQAFPFERRRALRWPWPTAISSSPWMRTGSAISAASPTAGRWRPDEIALRYRVRGGQPNFATNAYFFEEGQANAYAGAAFGEFRVGDDGEMILTGLRNARFEALNAAP